MENLIYTKFLDIQSPVGIEQNEKEKFGEFHSIGVDIYVPRPTKEFIKAILKSNKNSHINTIFEDSEIIDFDFEDSEIIDFEISNDNGILLSYSQRDNKYCIYHNIQIPTGLGILIPKDYYLTVNPKSSNFQNGYSVVEGFIDENYTYGMGVQIILLEHKLILEPNQKFAQLLLKKSNFIDRLTEIPLTEWEKLEAVKLRREVRTGGFGTTGKFDKTIN